MDFLPMDLILLLVWMLVGFDYRVLVCGSMVLNHGTKG